MSHFWNCFLLRRDHVVFRVQSLCCLYRRGCVGAVSLGQPLQKLQPAVSREDSVIAVLVEISWYPCDKSIWRCIASKWEEENFIRRFKRQGPKRRIWKIETRSHEAMRARTRCFPRRIIPGGLFLELGRLFKETLDILLDLACLVYQKAASFFKESIRGLPVLKSEPLGPFGFREHLLRN